MIRAILAFLCLCGFTACTYSVIMNHTEGTAEDVVDTNQDASPDVKPNISIPAAAL